MEGDSSKILGVLLGWLSGGYHNELIEGIREEAEKRGISIIYFAGRQLNAPSSNGKLHNRVYNLIDKECIDGLIVTIPVMSHLKPADYYECLSRFVPIPVITLSFKCPPFPSVEIDNRTGFKLLIEHMIDKHGLSKFAFIHGPGDHPDAIERYEVYKEVLASRHIALDETKTLYGPFHTGNGVRAVKVLLDERKLKIKEDIEVFICCNDHIALGALQELEARGITVPLDVAVTGFDDIEQAKNRNIPLTTVSQSIRELGREGVKALALNKKSGKLLPTLFLPRGTCGCYLSVRSAPVEIARPGEGDMEKNLLHGIRQILFSSGRVDSETTLPEKLIQIFLRPVSEQTASHTQKDIYSFFLKWVEKWNALEFWQDALIFLEDKIPRGDDSREKKKLFQFAQACVTDLSRRIEMKKRTKLERWEENLRGVNEGLSATSNLNEIGIYISKTLHYWLKINSSFIFLYNNLPDYSHDFKVLYTDPPGGQAVRKNKIFRDFTATIRTFLLPLKPFSFIVQPLIFKGESLGFVLLEYNIDAGLAYESLRTHISRALKHSFTIIESEYRNRKLKELNGKLVQSAHHAGMAQVVINLMHTVGNISNSVFVTIDQLKQNLRSGWVERLQKANTLLKKNVNSRDFYFKQESKRKLMPVYYDKLAEMLENEDMEIANRVLELENKISRILKVIDSQQEISEGIFVLESINLVECLENSLILKNESLKQAKVQVIKNYNVKDSYVISCFYNKLLYILTVLLETAIHRISEAAKRIINLYIGAENGRVLLKIAIANMVDGVLLRHLTEMFNRNLESRYKTKNIDFRFIANSFKEIGASIRVDSKEAGDEVVLIVSFPGQRLPGKVTDP